MSALNPRLDIDLAAICANYRRLANAAPGAAAAAVVKCDAYGLGAAAVARALFQHEGCRTFFVAYSEEGAALRAAIGPDAEILIFNGPFPEFIDAYRAHRLTPVINTLDQARLWAREMASAPTAIHIDTGMHRLGLPPAEIGALQEIDRLNVALVTSHLACASEPAHAMNARQRQAFDDIARQFPAARKSLSSSGGALIGGAFSYDLVRLGVGLYGVNPLDAGASPVAPVASLTAPVIQTHQIKAGETVGYGASFTARRDGVLATVSLGYGDGYPRAASGRGRAFLGGRLVPIAGRVSMDLIVLDATDLEKPPAVGDRAEFFGLNLSVDDAASACGTIGYELLTGVGGLSRPRRGLGGRVERRYFWNGAPADVALTGDAGK